MRPAPTPPAPPDGGAPGKRRANRPRAGTGRRGNRGRRVPDVAGGGEGCVQFVNLRMRTFSTSPKAASVAIADEPP